MTFVSTASNHLKCSNLSQCVNIRLKVVIIHVCVNTILKVVMGGIRHNSDTGREYLKDSKVYCTDVNKGSNNAKQGLDTAANNCKHSNKKGAFIILRLSSVAFAMGTQSR